MKRTVWGKTTARLMVGLKIALGLGLCVGLVWGLSGGLGAGLGGNFRLGTAAAWAADVQPTTRQLGRQPVWQTTRQSSRQSSRQPTRQPTTRQPGRCPPDGKTPISSFRCVVGWARGSILVKVSQNYTMDLLSAAGRSPNSTTLSIVYNPDLLNCYQPLTRLFWLEHECAHHTLGHTFRTQAVSPTRMAQDEDDADCTAIQTMVRGLRGQPPMIDEQGLEAIATDVKNLMRGGGIYKPGPERARQIRACARAVQQN